MKYRVENLQKMYIEIKNLLSEQNWKGTTMKHMLLGVTDTEEIRRVLIDAVTESGYDRKEITRHLQRLYPLQNWSDRCLNYLLTDSNDIPITKVNQLMEFLFPSEKFEFNVDFFEGQLNEMFMRFQNLHKEFRDAVRKDSVVDDKEFNLITANVNIASTLLLKFLAALQKSVNLKLGM